MSREVREDLNELLSYNKEFSIAHLLTDEDYIKFISTCHKKYYSFFVASAEFEECFTDDTYKFLKEANSDLATALFHLMTGTYKSARLILRSSIECFLKAFVRDWIPDIEQERRVFEIFNKIKSLSYFSLLSQKEQFNTIHNIYKELCKDVHVADDINMIKVDALDLFPKYNKDEAEAIEKLFLNIIPAYLFLLADKFNSRFHTIHYKNRAIILLSIKKELRPVIMKINN